MGNKERRWRLLLDLSWRNLPDLFKKKKKKAIEVAVNSALAAWILESADYTP